MRQVSGNRLLHQSSVERAVVDAFRRGGWKVLRQPHLPRVAPDLIVRRGSLRYVVELKSAAEARRDRLIPLLAQAILEAKAAAKRQTLRGRLPLAIVGAPHLPESLIKDLQSFAAHVAPDVAIGILDLEGSRLFIGRGLESLSVRSARPGKLIRVPPLKPSLHLFSDLNQWMLKILLAPRVPERLLRAPRQEFRSVPALAKAADVSVMSAFRLVSLLRADGFVDQRSPVLRLVRVEELLRRWRSSNLKPARELPMRWLIPGDPERQFADAVRAYSKEQSAQQALRGGRVKATAPSRPRVCLALFAAADALGFGFVRGVASHLYLERFDPIALESLGLVPASSGQPVDVFVRVPSVPQAVFRAAVDSKGLPVSDILQVWLDVSDHPSRGDAQAQWIWRRVLAPAVKHSAGIGTRANPSRYRR